MTNDQLQAHLVSGMKFNTSFGDSYRKPSERLLCKDGFSLSAQGNQFTYSTPRSIDGPYTHVEVGFPSRREPLLDEYGDYESDDVYGWVPVETVLAIINKHGGLA